MFPLTPENFREQARLNLTRSPIFERDFELALKLPLNINKIISKYKNGSRGANLRILINDGVTFFNYFDRLFGLHLMIYLVGKNNELGVKALAKLLGCACDGPYDEGLYEKLLEETKG